jgi:transposase
VARRHQELAAEIARLDAALEELLSHAAPKQLLAKQGVATQVAATLLATAGDNPSRVRREASFAALCGASLHLVFGRDSQYPTGISGAPFLLLVLGMKRLSCVGAWIAADQGCG